MDLFEAIATRASAIKLAEPAPSREHLQKIIEAGARAPDHGRLAPWRFVVITGAARERLGEAMADALRVRDPASDEAQLQREREKAARAPAILAVAARTKPGHKVPEIEQVLAVGAAVENMFLAAHALGYGAMWKTGPAAYDPRIKAVLELATEDQIVAFLYLGTPTLRGQARPGQLEERVRWLEA